MQPVAVVGNLARDLVDGGPPRVGGCPFYAAQALRLLDVPARIVTKCAEEDAALLDDLTALGVPVTWGAASATATFALDYEDERRRVRIERLGDAWTPGDVRGWAAAALAGAAWVHVAPLARSDFPVETLAALARGRRLSLDGQGLVRPGRVGELRPDADFDSAVLAHVHALKLAEEEADVVLDSVDARSVAALGVPEVLVTLGPAGSIVFAGGVSERVAAHPVDADPTGAGDAYMAAYVVHRSAGMAPVEAATRASRLVERVLSQRLRAATA